MKLGKGLKILIGALTFWPFLYLFLFSGFILMQAAGSMRVERSTSAVPPFFVFMTLHLLTMLCMMGLLVFYIVFVFKSDRIPEPRKPLWAIVLFMGNLIAMPIFFFLYVWKDPAPPASDVSPSGK